MQFPRLQFPRFLKNKFVAIAAAGILSLGIVGGLGAAAVNAAMAHGPGFGNADNFPARVAQKLNSALGLTDDNRISTAQMATAFNAATAELQEEKLQQKLTDAGVAQADSDAIMTWFRAWPYAELVKLRTIGFARSADQVARKLSHLVEREHITQAQSDGILSWYNDRPDLPEELERAGHGRRHGKGDGDRGGARHHRRGNNDRDNS